MEEMTKEEQIEFYKSKIRALEDRKIKDQNGDYITQGSYVYRPITNSPYYCKYKVINIILDDKYDLHKFDLLDLDGNEWKDSHAYFFYADKQSAVKRSLGMIKAYLNNSNELIHREQRNIKEYTENIAEIKELYNIK